jgi:hypothetical protein
MAKHGLIEADIKFFTQPNGLRQKILLFEKLYALEMHCELGIEVVEKWINENNRYINRQLCIQNISDFKFLIENEEIILVKKEHFEQFTKGNLINAAHEEEGFDEYLAQLTELMTQPVRKLPEWNNQTSDLRADFNLRVLANCLSNLYKNETYALLDSVQSFKFPNFKKDAISDTLRSLPLPDDSYTIQEILDFKSAGTITHKYNNLINWINQIAKESLAANEVEERFRSLYSDYIEAINIVKGNKIASTLEIIFLAVMSSHPATISLAYLGKPVFEILKLNFDAKRDESNLPGRELAYIYSANTRFS